MVAEVAVAGECDAIVTHNRRDFAGVDAFGLTVWIAGEFLGLIGATK